MGFLKKWFGVHLNAKSRQREEYIEEEDGDSTESVVLRRDSVQLRDQAQRTRYVQSCLTQMKDAEDSIGDLTREYSMVTSYLTDMEEIEALPPTEKKELENLAESITGYEKEKNLYEDAKDRMTETAFRQAERMEDEIEEGIAKLTEAEQYQEKIHQDMRRLSGEKHAYQYRKHDLQNLLVNLRGMLVMLSFAFVTCMVILLLLQELLRMDVHIGYVLTCFVTVCAVFLIYLKYTDALKEKKRVEKAINRLILLLNRVKIRYVNNTNLLDYLTVKYHVNSAAELTSLWEAYQKECAEREKFRELHEELEFQRKELLRILRRYQIKDPEIWLHQTEAIVNPKEMVEIRHGLILRRQKLRKQMEYNERLAESAQTEIRALAEEFPMYAAEIMEMVSQYTD